MKTGHASETGPIRPVTGKDVDELLSDDRLTVSIQTSFRGRLAFIRRFYFTAAAPFEASRRRNITRHAPNEHLQDESESWEGSTKGLELLGQCSLSLVAKAIQDCLREFAKREGAVLGPKKPKESWFDYYCRYLEDNTSFRWNNSPVPRDQIEQINLCRNDFLHDPDIDGNQPKQSVSHFEKHPLSRFNDGVERAVVKAIAQVNGEEFEATPGSLSVTRYKLLGAIADAGKFCAFVETQNKQP